MEENKKNFKENTVQKFYSNNSALGLELSKNGVFVILAKIKERHTTEKNGQYGTYDWENKLTVKLSVGELCNFSVALKVFQSGGPEAFTKHCQRFFNNERYKTFVIVHDATNGKVYTGFKLYIKEGQSPRLIYETKTEKDTIGHLFSPSDLPRLEKFLDYLINMCFHKNF